MCPLPDHFNPNFFSLPQSTGSVEQLGDTQNLLSYCSDFSGCLETAEGVQEFRQTPLFQSIFDQLCQTIEAIANWIQEHLDNKQASEWRAFTSRYRSLDFIMPLHHSTGFGPTKKALERLVQHLHDNTIALSFKQSLMLELHQSGALTLCFPGFDTRLNETNLLLDCADAPSLLHLARKETIAQLTAQFIRDYSVIVSRSFFDDDSEDEYAPEEEDVDNEIHYASRFMSGISSLYGIQLHPDQFMVPPQDVEPFLDQYLEKISHQFTVKIVLQTLATQLLKRLPQQCSLETLTAFGNFLNLLGPDEHYHAHQLHYEYSETLKLCVAEPSKEQDRITLLMASLFLRLERSGYLTPISTNQIYNQNVVTFPQSTSMRFPGIEFISIYITEDAERHSLISQWQQAGTNLKTLVTFLQEQYPAPMPSQLIHELMAITIPGGNAEDALIQLLACELPKLPKPELNNKYNRVNELIASAIDNKLFKIAHFLLESHFKDIQHADGTNQQHLEYLTRFLTYACKINALDIIQNTMKHFSCLQHYITLLKILERTTLTHQALDTLNWLHAQYGQNNPFLVTFATDPNLMDQYLPTKPEDYVRLLEAFSRSTFEYSLKRTLLHKIIDKMTNDNAIVTAINEAAKSQPNNHQSLYYIAFQLGDASAISRLANFPKLNDEFQNLLPYFLSKLLVTKDDELAEALVEHPCFIAKALNEAFLEHDDLIYIENWLPIINSGKLEIIDFICLTHYLLISIQETPDGVSNILIALLESGYYDETFFLDRFEALAKNPNDFDSLKKL